MRMLIAVLALTTAVACGKKVDAAPVNPQITDAVTQVKPVGEVLDAGSVTRLETVNPESVECSPDHPPVPEVLQSRVEKAPVCSPVK